MSLLRQGSLKRGEDVEPVSPKSQYWNSSALSVAILGVFEFEIPLEVSRFMISLENEFLPVNPRFSSIMVEDEHGVQQWKRVVVKLEDHVVFPVFPDDSSPESNEEYLQEYLSEMAMDPFRRDIPMWEVHMIMYPTTSAARTVIYKVNHAIGDGYSFMAALFSIVKRADDPSLPLTMPSSKVKHLQSRGGINICEMFYSSLSMLWYTTTDFIWSFLKSTCLEDDHTAIRSGIDGIRFHPLTISSIIFPLDRIKQVKTMLGATVNDVICGIIFYGTELYMQMQKGARKTSSTTALILLNTRRARSYNYKDPKEMLKQGTEAPWGNRFAFLFVPLPKCGGDGGIEKADPLGFVLEAKTMLEQKKKSLAAYLNAMVSEILRKLRGPQAAARLLHDTMWNNSMTISNMMGPMEKIAMADQPVKSFYFMTVGMPQSLTITVVSYMGSLRVGVGAEKGFIDSPLLISCFEKAFVRISEAAGAKGQFEGKDSPYSKI